MQIPIFANREDLLLLTDLLEQQGALKYVKMGNFNPDQIPLEIHHGSSIPALGLASSDAAAACDAYLVCAPETTITVRQIDFGSEVRICVDQLLNPDSVEFKPGGIWNNQMLLHGRIATASRSPQSHALMRQFESALRKVFARMKAFYIGPQALILLNNGMRLTSSAHSPPEFDLRSTTSRD